LKELPADIKAFRSIENPLRTSLCWPVSDLAYKEIYETILDKVFGVCESADQRDADLLLSDTAFFGFLIQVLHYKQAQCLAKRGGSSLLVTEISSGLLNPDWQKISNQYERVFSEIKVHNKFRSYWLNGRYNEPLKVIRGIIGGKRKWSLGAVNQCSLHQEYLEASSHAYWFYDWDCLEGLQFKNIGLKLGSSDRQVRERALASDIISLIRQEGFASEYFHDWQEVTDALASRLTILGKVYDLIAQGKIKSIPEELIVAAENDFRRKVIILALRRRGAKTLGFVHGDPIFGVYDMPYYEKIAKAHVTNYLTPGKNSAALCNTRYGATRLGPLGMKFSRFETNRYQKPLVQTPERGILLKAENKVMIMGWPMNTSRLYDDPRLFFFSKLQVEFELIRLLRELGKFIIYRPHPDRLEHVIDIVKPNVDEISLGRYEEATRSASTLIFTHPGSSTFGPALTGGHNVILLNDKSDHRWHKIGLDQLSKRCHLIDIRNDSVGMPLVNKEQLSEALEISDVALRKTTNRDFIEFYWS